MMEKIGEIREGVTPPENDESTNKTAQEKELSEHVTKRLADKVAERVVKPTQFVEKQYELPDGFMKIPKDES